MACCTSGFTCASEGVCQSTSASTSTTILRSTSLKGTPTNSFTNVLGTPDSTGTTNSSNNAAVIGGAVGGTIGGLLLIGGGVWAWYFFTHGAASAAGAAGTAGAAGNAGNAGTLGNTGAGAGAGHGWTAGSPSAGQPLMTSTGMPFTPAAGTDAGFAAQQPYGAPGSLYLPPTPSNATDYNQPPVSQYPQNEYGAAVPPNNASGPAPWTGGQMYGQPGAFGAPGAGSTPDYSTGSPALNQPGGSAYGATPETMQPYGGYESRSSPGPQVQTWVERPERSGGN